MKSTILAAIAAATLLATITSPADAARRLRAGPAPQAAVECLKDEGLPAYRSGCAVAQPATVGRTATVSRGKASRQARATARLEPAGPAKASGSAVVRSASGATARVSPAAAPKFQALVDWIEAHGVSVDFMGGNNRAGKCWSGGMHPCGTALDINQLARGVVTKAFPAGTDSYAASLGLVSGSSWCNDDTGHFQVGGWSGCRTAKRTHARIASLHRPRRVAYRRHGGHREARRPGWHRMALLRVVARR